MIKVPSRAMFVSRPLNRTLDRPLDWRRKMSDHIAYALLVYTGLQIFVTISALKASGGSLLPCLALVVLVAIGLPFALTILFKGLALLFT